MGKIEKLVAKFLSIPNDLTWTELVKVLAHFGFTEAAKKGRTGGSRVRFANDKKRAFVLHRPHPRPIVKPYVIRQVIDKFKSWEIL